MSSPIALVVDDAMEATLSNNTGNAIGVVGIVAIATVSRVMI
jgi:hypothetical protein